MTVNGPYTQFRCYGSKISVRITPQSTSDNLQVSLVPSNNNLTTPANYLSIDAMPFGKFININSASSARQNTISGSMHIHTLMGVNKSVVQDDDSYAGNYNTDPQNMGKWVLDISAVDGQTAVGYIQWECTIEYFVELTGLNQAGLSEQ